MAPGPESTPEMANPEEVRAKLGELRNNLTYVDVMSLNIPPEQRRVLKEEIDERLSSIQLALDLEGRIELNVFKELQLQVLATLERLQQAVEEDARRSRGIEGG